MGKRGPKPKPTALKALAGSWRAGENPLEPKPKSGMPLKPTTLTEYESQWWDLIAASLLAQGTLTMTDGVALHGLVISWCRYLTAQETIAKTTLLIRNGTQPVANPLLGIQNQAFKQMKHWMACFGMTPADRTRLIVQGPPPPKVAEEPDLLG